MALVWLESFGLHGSGDMHRSLSRKWKGGTQKAGGLFMVPGRRGGWAVRMNASKAADRLVTPTLPPHSVWVVGLSWRPLSDSLDGTLVKVIAPDGLEQVSFRFLPNQQAIHVYRGDGVKLATFPLQWHIDEWQCLEMKCRIDSSNGMVAVRANGKTVGQQFVGNTRSSPNFDNACSIGIAGVNGSYDLADVYVFDGSGYKNNDFLEHANDYAVFSMLPCGAAQHTEWLPKGVIYNFQASMTNDKAFLRADQTGQTDTYRFTCTDSRKIIGDIRGISCQVCCKRGKNAASIPKLSVLLYSGQEHAVASLDVPNTMYDTSCIIQEKQANTNETWTTDNLDSLEAGFRLSAVSDRTVAHLNSIGIEALGAISNLKEFHPDGRFNLIPSSTANIRLVHHGEGAMSLLISESGFSRQEGWDKNYNGQGAIIRLAFQGQSWYKPFLSHESRGVSLAFEGQSSFRKVVNR